MDLHPAVIFLGGLVVIILGAEMMLRSATRIASMLGVSPIIIGLTVVSVGTTMPELAVGLTAAAEGKGALAVGNIAGTNILNILLILGLSALIRPLPTRSRSVRLEVPVMILSALLLVAMSIDGVLSPREGGVLIFGAVAYLVTLVRLTTRERARTRHEFAREYSSLPPSPPPGGWRQGAWNGLLLVTGIALTMLGAELLVSGAVQLALAYGVSDAFIGLTIVAIGTSAPELATALVATWKNDRDVAIGNLIGSTIYNVLVILGLTLVAGPETGISLDDAVLRIDLPLAALVALVCLPVFKSDRCVSRREGAAFVAAYLVYLATLLLFRH